MKKKKIQLLLNYDQVQMVGFSCYQTVPGSSVLCTIGIWIADFYESGIQIICYSDAWFLLLTEPENSGQIVCFSDHNLNSRLKESSIQNTIWITDHLIIGLVRYSDPHSSSFKNNQNPSTLFHFLSSQLQTQSSLLHTSSTLFRFWL